MVLGVFQSEVEDAIVADSTPLVEHLACDEKGSTAKQFSLVFQVGLFEVEELHVENGDVGCVLWAIRRV